jgi:hypothetical protein
MSKSEASKSKTPLGVSLGVLGIIGISFLTAFMSTTNFDIRSKADFIYPSPSPFFSIISNTQTGKSCDELCKSKFTSATCVNVGLNGTADNLQFRRKRLATGLCQDSYFGACFVIMENDGNCKQWTGSEWVNKPVDATRCRCKVTIK